MEPFNIGQEYERSELLSFVGSKQQQTGVIWGKKEPGCIIATSGGRHGKKVGYSDERLQDGSWWYFGQGQNGDHSINNAANAKLVNGKESILLFTTREPTAGEVKSRGNYKKLFAFQGAFNVSHYEVVIPTSGSRKDQKLLRFLFSPASNITAQVSEPLPSVLVDISILRQQLISFVQPDVAQTRITSVEYRRRCAHVRKYAILRAKGNCEACGALAPFVDSSGNGFLEVHHIVRLADDGIDAPYNVAAICPNCHRRAHYSVDRESFRQQLLASIFAIENKIC
ncbi:HNH endonuclease [Oxalobacteraceae bacterium CAVE-383]|nr:HNH endonuclease [Oxalobacteraceae bacterium CAVE-383]